MASAIEYGLIAALVAVGAVTATSAIGTAQMNQPEQRECVTVQGFATAETLADNLIAGNIDFDAETASPDLYRVCFAKRR